MKVIRGEVQPEDGRMHSGANVHVAGVTSTKKEGVLYKQSDINRNLVRNHKGSHQRHPIDEGRGAGERKTDDPVIPDLEIRTPKAGRWIDPKEHAELLATLRLDFEGYKDIVTKDEFDLLVQYIL